MKEDIEQIIKFAEENEYTILIPSNYDENEDVTEAVINFKEKTISFGKP